MWFLGATVAPAAYRPFVQIAMRRARYLSQNCHKTLSPSISVGHYLFAAWYRCSVPMEMQLTITSIHFMMSMLQGQVQIRLDRETCNEFYEVCEHHTSSPVFAFCAQVFWAALPPSLQSPTSNLPTHHPSSPTNLTNTSDPYILDIKVLGFLAPKGLPAKKLRLSNTIRDIKRF